MIWMRINVCGILKENFLLQQSDSPTKVLDNSPKHIPGNLKYKSKNSQQRSRKLKISWIVSWQMIHCSIWAKLRDGSIRHSSSVVNPHYMVSCAEKLDSSTSSTQWRIWNNRTNYWRSSWAYKISPSVSFRTYKSVHIYVLCTAWSSY